MLEARWWGYRFRDDAVEAAWLESRLPAFRVFNSISAWLLFALSLLLMVAQWLFDLGDSSLQVVRLGGALLWLLILVVARTTTDVRRGDAAVTALVLLSVTVIWEGVFIRLRPDFVLNSWQIVAATFQIGLLVVTEVALPLRVLVSLFVTVMTLRSGLELAEMSWVTPTINLSVTWGIGAYAAQRFERVRRESFFRQRQLDEALARADGLLRNILPDPIADRLLEANVTIADRHERATVLFADIVGFTPLSASMEPEELVKHLDAIFREFDALCARHGVEKIKTIGDAYMAASGVPNDQPEHVSRVLELGRDMIAAVAVAAEARHLKLELRVGVHTGPVVAGVIGQDKFIYDLWGDTVNTASRMESHGVSGRVQVSRAVADAAPARFAFEPRGPVEVKGKGALEVFLLASDGDRPAAESASPAPTA